MAVATVRRPSRVAFVCSACGASAPKWQGRCDSCAAWNTLEAAPASMRSQPTVVPAAALNLALVDASGSELRLESGIGEVDRVLGGGFVPGSVVLLGGDPGVGKSTLALQVTAACGVAALYCTGEESASQVAMRARRIGCALDTVALLVESDLDTVVATIESADRRLAVVDSVQTLYDPAAPGTAGSPGQVRNAVVRLVAAAKQAGVAVLLVGHVTKEGAIAGPRTLEHLVDVVLYLEGERLGEDRLLRGVKNRFGSTGELGILAMRATGMQQVDAPGRSLLDSMPRGMPGTVLTVTCEGVRPLALEVQALAVRTRFAMPRRTVSGYDVSRLHLVLAVLEKRTRLPMSEFDVFVNVVGGAQLSDPGADLAVALAVAGSVRNQPLGDGAVVLGEIGLGGEVRRVSRFEARLREAAALGLDRAIVPAAGTAASPAISCRRVATLEDALQVA
jgi:DNA repair protein RadA/Sms